MKNILIISVIVFSLFSLQFAQERKFKRMDGHKKMDHLEKLKLMEILDLDEETFIRFFSRHSEFKKQSRESLAQQDKRLEEMEAYFASAKLVTDKEYEEMIQKYLAAEKKIFEERETYLKSLSTILKPEQICKIIVFEKRFREEIRDVLLKDRRRMKMNDQR